MTREIKIGILAIVAIFGAVWGYKFVKGQDLFKSSNTYKTSFSDVTALDVSSAVTLNGFKVGVVESIELNLNDVSKMLVTVRIDGNLNIPKDAKLLLKSEGIVGGKYLALSFSKPCSGADCAIDGQYFVGEDVGFIGSMISKDELGNYVGNITGELSSAVQKLGADGEKGKINEIVRQLESLTRNLNSTSITLDKMLQVNSSNIAGITSSMNKITQNLAQNNVQITQILNNLNATTKSLAEANFSQTAAKTNTMIDNASVSMKKLQGTLDVTANTLTEFKQLAQKIDRGDGSLGKLINDRKLYDNLETTSKNLSLLLQDLRLNPKRYVNVSVFGKKAKEYTLPENDPANPSTPQKK